MSTWAAHLVCDKCWSDLHPEGRTPGRLKGAERLPCCACGEWTESGIYIRAESATMLCKGLGPNHDDE